MDRLAGGPETTKDGGTSMRDVRRAGFAVIVAVCAAAMLLAGCAQMDGGAKSASGAMPMGDPNAQTCGVCGDKGPAPQVDGVVEVVDGKQRCAIGVEGGYLSPNTFTVRSGQPVELVFEGSAQGCLAMPKIETLGQKADFKSGTATMDLGTLEPGTYPITCGMDEPMGSITVE